jgi:hypothetical protein
MLSTNVNNILACAFLLVAALQAGGGAEIEVVNYNLILNISDGNWPIFLPYEVQQPILTSSISASTERDVSDAAKEAQEAKASLAEAMAKLYAETEASFSGEATVSAESTTASSSIGKQTDLQVEKKDRIYWLRKCSGSGCPYTASWLAHINLYKRLVWNIDNTKMEAASFEIFDKASFKFQLEDHTAFFVHHLSHFEHAVHK